MNLTVSFREDLYEAGLTEDGEQYIGSLFYVFIEKVDGSRFRHYKTFKGCKAAHDEDHKYFIDLSVQARDAVRSLCDRIEKHLESGGSLNMDLWSEMAPRYGSEAYLDR
jgi:hypothetical protein